MANRKISKDWVEAYFDFGVDVINRRIFVGDVEPDSINAAIKGLYLMETESKEKPCDIFISSDGGSVYEALALYDIINCIKCPVNTFAYGRCMSASVLLLAAGVPGQRWVSPNVAFMHHDWSAEIQGKGGDLATTVKHFEEVSTTWTKLLAKHSSKDFKWWNSRAKKQEDFYFGSKEALEWGLADNIWLEKQLDS